MSSTTGKIQKILDEKSDTIVHHIKKKSIFGSFGIGKIKASRQVQKAMTQY